MRFADTSKAVKLTECPSLLSQLASYVRQVTAVAAADGFYIRSYFIYRTHCSLMPSSA